MACVDPLGAFGKGRSQIHSCDSMDATSNEHQTAIVTGASSAIGLGMTQALLEGGEHDGRRSKRDGRWFDRDPAGSDLLRGGGDRRRGGGPFQPRPVCVGAWRDVRGKGSGLLEIAGYLQAALLGRAVGYPVRAVYKERLEAAVPLRSAILPRSGAGAVSDLPADERRGVFRASAGGRCSWFTCCW